MGTLLDLLLLLVICKEALTIGTDVPYAFWMTFIIGLPFMLGMANSFREDRSSVVHAPIRAFIGELLTLGTFVLFLVLITYQGLAAAFWGLFMFTLIPYFGGRLFGMTAKGLGLIFVILVGVILFNRFSAGTL